MAKRTNQAISLPRFNDFSNAAEQCVLRADRLLTWGHGPSDHTWYLDVDEGDV